MAYWQLMKNHHQQTECSRNPVKKLHNSAKHFSGKHGYHVYVTNLWLTFISSDSVMIHSRFDTCCEWNKALWRPAAFVLTLPEQKISTGINGSTLRLKKKLIFAESADPGLESSAIGRFWRPLKDIQVLSKPLRWFGSNLVHLVIPKSLERI